MGSPYGSTLECRNHAGLAPEVGNGEGLQPGLYSLTYVSLATELDPGLLLRQAHEISASSSLRNRQHGLTGALSVGGGWFAQVLEGPRRALLSTFDRLLHDPRHTDIRLIDFAPTKARAFAAWSMGWSGTIPPALVLEAVADYAAREAAVASLMDSLALLREMRARIAPGAPVHQVV